MLKKGDNIIFNNRGKKEFGKIIYCWRRKDIKFYNIKSEKGIEYSGITTNSNFSCHIVEDLSIKLNENKLCQLD